jgi:hypothetical protein
MSNFDKIASPTTLKKVFDKIASPTTLCIDEREMEERAAISYFFQLHPYLCLYKRRKK